MFNGYEYIENRGRPHNAASHRRKPLREERGVPRAAAEGLRSINGSPDTVGRARARPGYVSYTNDINQKSQGAAADSGRRKWGAGSRWPGWSIPRPSFARVLFLILILQLISICFFGLNMEDVYGIGDNEDGNNVPMLEKTRRLLGSLASPPPRRESVEVEMNEQEAARQLLCSPDYDEGNRTGGSVTPPPETSVCSPLANDNFIIVRIIGNDLPPRHSPNQTIDNLRFILEHEPDLEACEKWWLLNRVVNKQKERDVITVLEEFSQNYIVIPFEEDAIAKVQFIFHQGAVDKYFAFYKKAMMQRYILQDIYHMRNLYTMNNNGARNACVHFGKLRAKWTLPLDGNIYFTQRLWSELLQSMRMIKGCAVRYVMMPMARLMTNDVLLDPEFDPTEAIEEPQVMFRCDAREEFDPYMRYGRRPKVDLFFRLGYVGVWDKYKWDAYAEIAGEKNKTLSIDTGQFFTAGYVLRLSAGASKKAETTGQSGKGSARHIARLDGITHFLDAITEKRLFQHVSRSTRFFLTDDLLSHLRIPTLSQRRRGLSPGQEAAGYILTEAEKALESPVFSVTQKKGALLPANISYFYSLHPRYHPDPTKEEGVPYVQLLPPEEQSPAVIHDRLSDKFDSRRLIYMIDNVTVLSIAFNLTADVRYATKAIDILRTWFIANETRMEPNMEYACMIYTGELLPKFQGKDGAKYIKRFARGQASGIMEARPFYYLLDAIRLLNTTNGLTSEDDEAMRSWFREYWQWLKDSDLGVDAFRSLDFDGINYDLQMAAVSAFVGDPSENQGVDQLSWDTFLHSVLWAPFRLFATESKEGTPRRVFNLTRDSYRSEVEDFCSYVQGWEGITTMAHISGLQDGIWNARSQNDSSLATEFEIALEQAEYYFEEHEFDFSEYKDARSIWFGSVRLGRKDQMLRVGHLSMGCAPLPHLYLLSGKPKYSNLNKLLIDPEESRKKSQVHLPKLGGNVHISKALPDIRTASQNDESLQSDGNCLSLVEWEKEKTGDGELQYRPTVSYEEARKNLEKCLGKRPTVGYLTFAQHSGFTNQIKALLTALKFAHILNRTLVVPPVQPQMMLAFGSCKTQIVPPDHLIRMSEEKLHEIVRNLEYKPLANVIDFSTVTKHVTLVDWRDFFYIIRDSNGMENSTVMHDCMDSRWIYDMPEKKGVLKETREAKYTKTTTITTHPAFGIPANETWRSNVTYRDIQDDLGRIQSPLLRAGSMFGHDYFTPSTESMRSVSLMRKTEVLFFSKRISEAARQVSSRLGENWASWHLRIGDTFVQDAKRRAAAEGKELSMEEIIYGVSSQVENEVQRGDKLYIATDMPASDREIYIKHIYDKYEVFTLDDFTDILTNLSKIVGHNPAGYLDMMIASCATMQFFPTPGSSFSAYIRNLRRNHACEEIPLDEYR